MTFVMLPKKTLENIGEKNVYTNFKRGRYFVRYFFKVLSKVWKH